MSLTVKILKQLENGEGIDDLNCRQHQQTLYDFHPRKKDIRGTNNSRNWRNECIRILFGRVPSGYALEPQQLTELGVYEHPITGASSSLGSP